MPMIKRTLWLTLSYALMLPGCGVGYFADRATNPIVNANLSKDYTTLSMNAGRRTILVRQSSPDDKSSPLQQPQDDATSRICAEAPPDALEAYANAAALAARGAGSSGGSLGADFRRNFSTSSAPLLYRTQGLQMIRDAQFMLCVMHMNGAITRDQYLKTLMFIIPKASQLIKDEIPAIVKAAARPPVTINTPSVEVPAVEETAQKPAR